MQAELSLDRVRVVRNDFSDSDVEVAPLQARRRTDGEEPARENAPWSNAGSVVPARGLVRFFGAAQSLMARGTNAQCPTSRTDR